jgi:hypothetical protein
MRRVAKWATLEEWRAGQRVVLVKLSVVDQYPRPECLKDAREPHLTYHARSHLFSHTVAHQRLRL